MTPEQRPQDPHMDGADLRFETMEHGGEYPDAMPQAIKLSDAEGRSCIYVPITQDGKVVDSQGFLFDAEDEWSTTSDAFLMSAQISRSAKTLSCRRAKGCNDPVTGRARSAIIDAQLEAGTCRLTERQQ
jgi:hypothetical protein